MSEYELSLVELQGIFERYKRWVREGRKPYYQDGSHVLLPISKKQFFYDTYHESLIEAGTDQFEFRVQTSDSPEGDTWVEGKFRVNPLETVVEIVQQRAITC